MGAGARAERRERGWLDPVGTRSVLLWAGIVVPPLAWAGQLVIADMLFEVGCAPGVQGRELAGLGLAAWSVVVTSGAAAVTILSGAMALRALRALRARSDGTALDRAHAMALMGVASAGLYLALIAFGALPPFLLEPCAPLP